ncbi:MAG: YqiJ family protein [Planctomycetes bacterium]|jgi:membrane protein implicated in regulation of membrane protease activity|nr:YqiJ family protein [Planctomycetota bacterium]
MDFLTSFGAAYNIVFSVPLLFVLLFVLMQVVGFNLDHLLGAGVDAHADAGGSVDADGGVDGHVDGHADGDADGHVDGHGPFLDFLAFFNLGRVPMMLVVEILFATFGLTGVIFNHFVIEGLPFYAPWMKMGLSVPLAAVLAVIVGKTLSELMAAYVPTTGPQALKAKDLEGRVGEVVSGAIDAKYGRILLKDPTGQVHTVHGVMMDGEAPVPKGGRVVLASWDAAAKTYKCSAASPHAE